MSKNTTELMTKHRKLLRMGQPGMSLHPPASLFIRMAMAWIEDYHSTPHRGQGMRGRTPREAFEQDRNPRQKPTPAPDALAMMLAERITSLGGSSRYFIGGAVGYSNELKTQFANVPKALIDQHGAVSREVAASMAEGIRKRCLSSYGVGITGVAGPSGGTEQKPVGLVYIALAGEEGTQVVERNFPGDRARIRQFSTEQALEMIRRALL